MSRYTDTGFFQSLLRSTFTFCLDPTEIKTGSIQHSGQKPAGMQTRNCAAPNHRRGHCRPKTMMGRDGPCSVPLWRGGGRAPPPPLPPPSPPPYPNNSRGLRQSLSSSLPLSPVRGQGRHQGELGPRHSRRQVPRSVVAFPHVPAVTVRSPPAAPLDVFR